MDDVIISDSLGTPIKKMKYSLYYMNIIVTILCLVVTLQFILLVVVGVKGYEYIATTAVPQLEKTINVFSDKMTEMGLQINNITVGLNVAIQCACQSS